MFSFSWLYLLNRNHQIRYDDKLRRNYITSKQDSYTRTNSDITPIFDDELYSSCSCSKYFFQYRRTYLLLAFLKKLLQLEEILWNVISFKYVIEENHRTLKSYYDQFRFNLITIIHFFSFDETSCSLVTYKQLCQYKSHS